MVVQWLFGLWNEEGSAPAYWRLACAALLLGFGVCVLLGQRVIPWLVAQKINDGTARKASETLNRINQGKAMVPTMGGVFLVAAIALAALVLVPLEATRVWVVVGATLACAGLGMLDDWRKLKRKDRDGGLSARAKLAIQLGIGLSCAWILHASDASGVWVPFMDTRLELGWLAIPFGALVIVGASNAVNLSDGLDGLATGLSVLSCAALGLVAGLMQPLMGGAAQATVLGVLAFVLCGACLGFLVFNRHPARVFMGDTGSLALGAAIGTLALALHCELLLLLLGAVFVSEALSVMLQVGWFKLSHGKRIFRCAPLHHHFQFGGWHETKVTRRFWAAQALFCVLGVGLVLASMRPQSPESQALPPSAAATTETAPEQVAAR